jgi:EmrB/QacA subfamily drug resistance transporter
MAFFDSTVVNVALPVMQRELDMPVNRAQWVVEAYALMLSSLVLVGGALGDRFGRARVFTAGVALFAVASATCGFAPGVLSLILARGVQGIGAAMLVPGSLALISAAYPEAERGPAIGTWSAFSSGTSAVGPVLGGWIVASVSWRWIFFINVPVAALVILIAQTRVAETRDELAPQRMDWLGAFLVTLGLGLIVYALLAAEQDSGGHAIALMAAGAAAFAAFLGVEALRPDPMVPLRLFRSRTFAGTNLLTFLLYAALGGTLFFVPFNLIQIRHYSPQAAGGSLVPLVLLITAMSRWAGGLSNRFGARLPLVVGPAIAAVGLALLALPDVGGSYWTTVFPGVVALGIGMGITVAPLTATVMGAVDPHHAGVASGVNNAVARAAGLLAVAGLGVVLVAQFDRELDARLAQVPMDPATARAVDAERSNLGAAEFSMVDDADERSRLNRAFEAAYIAGFRVVMLCGALLAAAGALAAFVLVEPRRVMPASVDRRAGLTAPRSRP